MIIISYVFNMKMGQLHYMYNIYDITNISKIK